jgi:hypothetical protein
MNTCPDDPDRPPSRPAHRIARGQDAAHSPSIRSTRQLLALVVIGLVALTSVEATLTAEGMAVFERLLPVLTFVLGYFFHQR